MTDDEVRTIEQLLQKQLSENQEAVTSQIAALTKRVEAGFEGAATVGQVDAIAKHVQDIDERFSDKLATIVTAQGELAQDVDRIERRLTKDLDRLDDHGTRIDVLEKKTAHLPTPPATR